MIRRTVAVAATVVLIALTGFGTPGMAADGAATTVSGTGEFAALKITVSQTSNLINQVVRVSWTGGRPTVDTSVHTDYLQIMQCWGDDPSGPDREQCQFGALYTDTRGGAWTGSRQVTYGSTLKDEAEPIKAPADGTPQYVPFRAHTGGEPVVRGGGGEYFDATTTNEIPYGRTGADGTGEEFFEIQTAVEAPGLGCGTPVAAGRGRACWLVVVPRGSTEVDGKGPAERTHRWLDSSPLSATNWKNRIVVPLSFQPIGELCPIGAEERPTLGAEAMAEAVLRWQPALCAARSDLVFGYSQTTDTQARKRLESENPGLVFVNRPATPVTSRTDVYAPVAVTGLAIAVNLDFQAGFAATDQDRVNEGKRLTDLRLTPRLVAKLLTQSYRAGADVSRAEVAGNPASLSFDPEFQRHNPDWVSDRQLPLPIGDALVGVGQTDMATQLWEWILSDAEAKDFLAGAADPWGMRINPAYRALNWPLDTFPKSDLYCIDLRGDDGVSRPWCTLDMHPYANHMHDAARSASRGDTLVRNATSRDSVGNAVGWKKGTPQPPGKRAVLAVTDVATAQRYGLPMAELRNAAGAFVRPSTESLLAGVATMTRSSVVSGLLAPNPASASVTAYPLTSVIYAATVPAQLTAQAGKDYATLLRWAARDGQTPGVAPGQLPAGYAPLPVDLRLDTLLAANTIEADAGKKSAVPARPEPEAPATSGTAGTASAAPPASLPDSGTQPSLLPATATPAGHGSAVPVAESVATPGHRVGWQRWVPVLALGGALVTLAAGPVLMRVARNRTRRGG